MSGLSNAIAMDEDDCLCQIVPLGEEPVRFHNVREALCHAGREF
jgi:hypothetical protein